MSVPSGKRRWSLPDHDGVVMQVAFPFIYRKSLAPAVMYYLYERYWAGVSWGKYDPQTSTFQPMSLRDRITWAMGTIIAIVLIFLLVVYVGPLVKR